ncbi:MAG: hypothetical protein M1144_07060 [Candidatus Thermoplasmatota archaeon]|nr:hypothetical protein [Candidatus Thermoplasmatota archaeon]
MNSKDPSVRYFALTELLGLSTRVTEVLETKRQIPGGTRLRSLLSGQRADGGFGVHWYKKWAGPQWRLVSAVELGVPSGNRAAREAAKYLLSRLPYGKVRPLNIAGKWRLHASVLGNPLGVFCRLGMAHDPRVIRIASSLVQWQWPDGGWNCDSSKEASHSSFYESLATLWGLSEYLRATDDRMARDAVNRAAEFFLRHRLFRSCHGEAVVNPRWVKLHYPLYWHYDILQALRVLDRAGKLGDPRTREALDLVASKRANDGTWRSEGRYWHRGRHSAANTEVVDWGHDGPNEMITLNALRVLVKSRRIS